MTDTMKRFSKAATILEKDNSLVKMQKKGVKNKMKNLTHKLMDMLKEKHDSEHADNKSIQDSGEEEAQCVCLLYHTSILKVFLKYDRSLISMNVGTDNYIFC